MLAVAMPHTADGLLENREGAHVGILLEKTENDKRKAQKEDRAINECA